MTAMYILEPTVASDLTEGDSVLHQERGVFTLASRPLRLRGRGVDQQWVTLRFTDGSEIEVHEGDFFDKITGEAS